MSPWVFLSGTTELVSHKTNATLDLVHPLVLEYWASLYLEGTPNADKAYVDQSVAPEAWLAGLDKIVTRVLVTAGADEVLRDDIAQFVVNIKKYHGDVTAEVIAGEGHSDPLFDFAVKPTKLTEGGRRILEWFRSCMSVK